MNVKYTSLGLPDQVICYQQNVEKKKKIKNNKNNSNCQEKSPWHVLFVF